MSISSIIMNRHHNHSSDLLFRTLCLLRKYTVGLFENGPITHLASRGDWQSWLNMTIVTWFTFKVENDQTRHFHQKDRNHFRKSVFGLHYPNLRSEIRGRYTGPSWTTRKFCESECWIRIHDPSYRTFGHLLKFGPWSEPIVDRPLLRAILESSHVVKWTCRKSKHAYFSWIIQNRHLKVGSPSIWPTMTHQIFTSHYHRDRSKTIKSSNQLSNANTCKIMCIQKTDDLK